MVIDQLAVIGATGAVGQIVLRLLAERQFPAKRVRLFASERSAGKSIRFRDQDVTVEPLRVESFRGIDVCIASTPDDVARDCLRGIAEQGTIVVDESGAWRMAADVPLVVPEVNPEAIRGHRGLIASPNCSTTQMVVCLKPLHDAARIRRVVVSTYQAASGAGVGGQTDLEQGTRALLDGRPYNYSAFVHPLALNLIPQIGSAKHEGYTSEEMKMVWETHKILGDDSIRVCPTCIRVPVTNCHSESILVETERKLSVPQVRDIFGAAAGITVVDDLAASRYPMPRDCTNQDDVFVGRIREDLSSDCGVTFWCVSDNLRKGAATNAVQIAELLVRARTAV